MLLGQKVPFFLCTPEDSGPLRIIRKIIKLRRDANEDHWEVEQTFPSTSSLLENFWNWASSINGKCMRGFSPGSKNLLMLSRRLFCKSDQQNWISQYHEKLFPTCRILQTITCLRTASASSRKISISVFIFTGFPQKLGKALSLTAYEMRDSKKSPHILWLHLSGISNLVLKLEVSPVHTILSKQILCRLHEPTVSQITGKTSSGFE